MHRSIPEAAKGFVSEAGEGRALDVLGSPYLFKATSAETGGRFCCIECTIPPGAGAPPHTHSNEDEAFFVLSGEIVVEEEGSTHRLGARSFFLGPRGRQHSFRNETDAEARILVFCTPGVGMEQMFGAMDAATVAAGGMPPVEEIVAIAARHGVAIAPPPGG